MKPLFDGYEWDVSLVEEAWPIIDKMGKEYFELDYHEPQFDIVSAEMMLDAYCSIGMPVFYNHWSFGKQYAQLQRAYKKGKQNLAYEMVINSNPCLAYLMEDNTACVTLLVMVHANLGHAHFFKNNYLFKQHTDPSSMLSFLEYAKNYIKECEEKYGQDLVEKLLDDLHVVSKFGVDKFPKPPEKTAAEKKERILKKLDNERQTYNSDFDTIPITPIQVWKKAFSVRDDEIREFLEDDVSYLHIEEENLLKFVINYSRTLSSWQKEIVRIIMKVEQYFYPQAQTKIMNEGFACFIHYLGMLELYKQGHINEGAYIEFLELHTNVCFQAGMNHLNPYSIGFEIFMDIKRACENPDEEDYKWLPTVAGKKDWKTEIKNIVKYFKDESFVLQFLSPKVMRKLKLFAISDCEESDYVEVLGIHNDEDIELIRKTLSEQCERDNRIPNLDIFGLNRIDGIVDVTYHPYKGRELDDISLFRDIVYRLTGFKTSIQSEDDYGV